MKQADWLYSSGRYEEAAQIYHRTAVQFADANLPSSPSFWEANALAQLGRRAEAIDRFHTVAVDDSNALAADALERIGDLQMELGNANAALSSYTEYDRRFRNSSKRAALLVKAGLAQVELGNLIAADETFRRASDLGGNSLAGAQALAERASLALRRQDYGQASALADSILNNRTDEVAARAQFILGEVAFARRDFENARVAFLQVKLVYDAYPRWVARAGLRIGDCYQELGNGRQARRAYEDVLESHPADTLGVQARQRIERLGGQ